MARLLECREIYKAADIISKLSILPVLKTDETVKGNYIFMFEDTQEVRDCVREYLANKELKAFIEAFKYLRTLIYKEKRVGQSDKGLNTGSSEKKSVLSETHSETKNLSPEEKKMRIDYVNHINTQRESNR